MMKRMLIKQKALPKPSPHDYGKRGKPFEEMLKVDQRKHALRNIKQANMIHNVLLAKNAKDRKQTDM